ETVQFDPGEVSSINVNLLSGSNSVTIDPSAANLPVNIVVSGNDTIQGLTSSDNVTIAATGTTPGSLTISGPIAVGDLTAAGGNLNLTGNVAARSLNLRQKGGITGPANVTVSGQTTWADGVFIRSGTLNAEGGLVMGADDGASHSLELDGWTLNNAGAASW